jgi:hypothetical protein
MDTTTRALDKLLSKVTIADTPDPETGTPCWLWLGNAERVRMIRRAAWIGEHGPIPAPAVGRSHLWVTSTCGNRTCVRPDHLVLRTRGFVRQHLTDFAHAPRGERNGMVKLTEDDVRDIRVLCARGATQYEVADAYGISRSQVSGIVLRNQWKHVA